MKIPVAIIIAFIATIILNGCSSKKPIDPAEPRTDPAEEPSATASPGRSPVLISPDPNNPVPEPAPEPPPSNRDKPVLRPRNPSSGDTAAMKVIERGVAAMNQGDFETAEELFEQALRVSSSNGRSYYYLGVLSTKRKEHERALGFLAQAELYLSADDFWMSQVYLQEGLVHKELKNFADAKNYFEKALRRDPDNQWAKGQLEQMD